MAGLHTIAHNVGGKHSKGFGVPHYNYRMLFLFYSYFKYSTFALIMFTAGWQLGFI